MKNWSSTVTFWRNGNATQLQQLRHSPGVADRRRMHGMLSISAGVPGGRNYSDGSRELGSGIFCPGPPQPGKPPPGLCPGWQADVQYLVDALEPLWVDGSFSLLSLPDEVGCPGYVSVEHVDKASAAIKAAMAKWGAGGHDENARPRIHHNDCAVFGNTDMAPKRCQWPADISQTNCTETVPGWGYLPAAIDYFSTDRYWRCPNPPPIENCSLMNEDEAMHNRWYYESYIYPRLLPHQSVFVAPGIFGDRHCLPPKPHATNPCMQPLCRCGDAAIENGTLHAELDAMLVRKLRNYMDWIDDDNRVVGMLAYTWEGSWIVHRVDGFIALGIPDFEGVGSPNDCGRRGHALGPPLAAQPRAQRRTGVDCRLPLWVWGPRNAGTPLLAMPQTR